MKGERWRLRLFALCFCIDAMLGDPDWSFHPHTVDWRCYCEGERRLRRSPALDGKSFYVGSAY
jgi:hypothetical protein